MLESVAAVGKKAIIDVAVKLLTTAEVIAEGYEISAATIGDSLGV